MKFIKKHIYWILCTMILGAILLYACLRTESSPTRFLVSNEFGSQEITIYDAPDGSCYVFLPSYARMENITVLLPTNQKITLGEMELSNGMNCGQFELEKAYTFQDHHHRKTTLQFYRTENVAAMYIDTISHSMEHLHTDKNVEETASVTLYTADGKINYRDTYSTIKGRGNTTWNYNKKPYLLKLSNEANLLEMGAGRNWVLLANAADSSNLNNRIIYDLAEQVGFSWSPQGEYVDVYLNGEYNGLYLLSEKVEPGESRLQIDLDGNDFLGEFRLAADNTLPYYTKTSLGRIAAILKPEDIDAPLKTQIDDLIAQMEQEILSGTDLSQSSVIDLDSWARKYIIDEISANVDSDRASCYFYYSNGKFYAGPIWDYDKGFGNCLQSRNPFSFVANNKQRSVSYSLPYYPELYSNLSFRNRVKELYQTEFLPVLNELINDRIPQYTKTFSAAFHADTLRWQGLTPTINSPALIPTDHVDVLNYLIDKVEFLNSAWIDNVEYCTVQFELSEGFEFVNYAVKKGEYLTADNIDLENQVWLNSDTGAVFDVSEPIEQDLILVRQAPTSVTVSSAQNTGHSVAASTVICVFLIAILSILFVGFIIIELYRNQKLRRRSDG